jgi:hypothetical protein
LVSPVPNCDGTRTQLVSALAANPVIAEATYDRSLSDATDG